MGSTPTTRRHQGGDTKASDASRLAVVPAPAVDANMLGAGAGWYYDPADEAVYRYWDGVAWTDRLSETASA